MNKRSQETLELRFDTETLEFRFTQLKGCKDTCESRKKEVFHPPSKNECGDIVVKGILDNI